MIDKKEIARVMCRHYDGKHMDDNDWNTVFKMIEIISECADIHEDDLKDEFMEMRQGGYITREDAIRAIHFATDEIADMFESYIEAISRAGENECE